MLECFIGAMGFMAFVAMSGSLSLMWCFHIMERQLFDPKGGRHE